ILELQELCQKNIWPLPRYFAIKDVPDHSPRFKAIVSIDEASPSCNSIKQAQNEAAKLPSATLLHHIRDESVLGFKRICCMSYFREKGSPASLQHYED
ncbi:unnamed protein product, partial [Linum tenue]